MSPKAKKKRKPKLKSIPVIRRRLFRLVSQICRSNADFTCEICGMKKGEIYHHKPQRVEAHHIMSRSNENSPLKYDLRNMVCLCTRHHKTYRYSAHKHGLWFAREFTKIRPEDAEWIMKHTDDKVNLNDRTVLSKIEYCLNNNLPLDLKEHGVEYIIEEIDK